MSPITGVLRGALMRGYWRRPEATAEAFDGGWLHSGDLVRQDADDVPVCRTCPAAPATRSSSRSCAAT